jgi:hypothetical protein
VIYSGTESIDMLTAVTGDIYSPRFPCSPTLYIIARAVERQRAKYTENSGFASPTLGQPISTYYSP